jgi:hypothetical protein
MESKQNRILLMFISMFFWIMSLAGFAFYATSPVLRRNIDGLLLLAICILMFFIFSAEIFFIVRASGPPKFQRKKMDHR